MSLDVTFFVVSNGKSIAYRNSQGAYVANVSPGSMEVILVNDTWLPAAATITLAGRQFPLTVHRDTAYYIKPFSACSVIIQVEAADLAKVSTTAVIVRFFHTSEPKSSWVYGNAMVRYNSGREISVSLGTPDSECELVQLPERLRHLEKEAADTVIYRMVQA